MDVLNEIANVNLLENLNQVSDKIFICLGTDQLKINSNGILKYETLGQKVKDQLKEKLQSTKDLTVFASSEKEELLTIEKTKLAIKELIEVEMVNVVLLEEENRGSATNQKFKVVSDGSKTIFYSDGSTKEIPYFKEEIIFAKK